MLEILFRGRSPRAYAWLIGWIVGQAAAVGAMWVWRASAFQVGDWRIVNLFALGQLAALILVAVPMHGIRNKSVEELPKEKTFGFRYLHRINGGWHRMEDPPMNGFLTILSIRAAIAIFLLVTLTQNMRQVLPQRAHPNFLNWGELVTRPGAFLAVLIAIALGVSLVTTMAALLCTDYSLRFEWPQPDPVKGPANRVKLVLRQKAHQFNVIGFYCLMWSLAAATALVDFALCVVTTLLVFVVMWSYYFFPTDKSYASVPDLTNRTEEQATKAVQAAGLVPKSSRVPSSKPVSHVVSQSRVAQEHVTPGTEVSFEVSAGTI